MLFHTLQNKRDAFKRGLGLLLVAFIFYGTTVEAAHRHGRIPPPASNAAAASLAAPGSTSTTSTNKPGCSDCLLCQLHQNFSATLISVKLTVEPLRRLTHSRRSEPVTIRSIANSPQSGRAPPQAI